MKYTVMKGFLNVIPYILGLVYLVYCLFNVEAWVKSHTEKYLFFVIIVWVIAAFLAIVFLVLRVIKKVNLKMYLPLFFFIIGLIIYIVAKNIPCCSMLI